MSSVSVSLAKEGKCVYLVVIGWECIGRVQGGRLSIICNKKLLCTSCSIKNKAQSFRRITKTSICHEEEKNAQNSNLYRVRLSNKQKSEQPPFSTAHGFSSNCGCD